MFKTKQIKQNKIKEFDDKGIYIRIRSFLCERQNKLRNFYIDMIGYTYKI